MYFKMKTHTPEFVHLRNRRFHVRTWGRVDAPKMFLLHGWGDTSASFQFVVDALQGEWRVIAPDWRGFGKSQWNDDTYWFPDYFADLDALLSHYSPDAPTHLVAHSMGGTIAAIYAGLRAERVARLVNLEGGGLPQSAYDDPPGRARKWLDHVRKERGFRVYADQAAFAERLMRDNARLTIERARFLAQQVTDPCEGGVRFAGDPCHFWTNPFYYPIEDAKAAWRLVTAPVMWLTARDSRLVKMLMKEGDGYRDRIACFRDMKHVELDDAGHNMHHDQPEAVARLIEEFFA
jgi:pimeloyl-ACP methyl ester carboxylesterase